MKWAETEGAVMSLSRNGHKPKNWTRSHHFKLTGPRGKILCLFWESTSRCNNRGLSSSTTAGGHPKFEAFCNRAVLLEKRRKKKKKRFVLTLRWAWAWVRRACTVPPTLARSWGLWPQRPEPDPTLTSPCRSYLQRGKKGHEDGRL